MIGSNAFISYWASNKLDVRSIALNDPKIATKIIDQFFQQKREVQNNLLFNNKLQIIEESLKKLQHTYWNYYCKKPLILTAITQNIRDINLSLEWVFQKRGELQIKTLAFSGKAIFLSNTNHQKKMKG